MLRRVVIVITTAFIFKNLLHYFLDEPKTSETDSTSKLHSDAKILLTAKELSEKSNDNELFLAILGSVYDVSSGAKHYKPGGSYHFFLGKDASRAFVTGDFVNDLNDQIEDLSETQIADIFNWKSMYDTNYKHVGHVIGRFYDANGEKTALLINSEKAHSNQKEVEKSNAQFHTRFPSCNSEWSQEKGLYNLWCTRESGGVKRAWSGYPRLVFNPTTNSESCACVNENDLNHPNVKQYTKCDPKSFSCDPSQK
jgi:hypothetical protein